MPFSLLRNLFAYKLQRVVNLLQYLVFLNRICGDFTNVRSNHNFINYSQRNFFFIKWNTLPINKLMIHFDIFMFVIQVT